MMRFILPVKFLMLLKIQNNSSIAISGKMFSAHGVLFYRVKYMYNYINKTVLTTAILNWILFINCLTVSNVFARATKFLKQRVECFILSIVNLKSKCVWIIPLHSWSIPDYIKLMNVQVFTLEDQVPVKRDQQTCQNPELFKVLWP